ncbi:MAG: TonB-dependent receptor [Bacteroidetes bacterium]|nr:TonB-dependent receptor [Bacteroidota bacterium]
MRARLFFGLFMFMIILNTNGQKGRISGVVTDQNSGEGIPFATVALKGVSDVSVIKGMASDSDGKFIIDGLAGGNFRLIVSYIGYQTDSARVVVISPESLHVDLGKVDLALSTIALEEAEVRGMAATVSTRIDRKVYRAADFETARGGTATDFLNKLPSVSVGPDGEVSVRGTSDFVVYLNGKPTQMDPSMLLAQISGDAIESIEVITVPTARFDAQGKGGIININTHTRGLEGLSVSVNALVGGAPWGNLTGPYSGFSQNDNRYGGGMTVMYMKENLSLYGGLYYNHRRVNGRRTGDARLLQQDASYYHMVASGERPEWFENYSANAGFEYASEGGSAFSGSYYYGKRTEGRSAFYVYNNFYGDVDKDPVPGVPVDEDWVYNPNTDNRYGLFHVLSLEYSKSFDETSTLKLSGLYEHSGLSRELDNRNYSFDPVSETVGSLEEHFMQADDTPLDGIRFSVEYEKNLENGHLIGVGFQPQFLSQSGPFTYDTLNGGSGNWGAYDELENAIDLTRAIYAGYVDYSVSTEKLKVMAGLRLEYTDNVLDIENPDYFSIFDRETKGRYEVNQLDWFPTVHMNYLLSDKSEATLVASRRISRPPTKNMAPFLYRRHYEVYLVGDPALKPEYLNLVELTLERDLGKQDISLTGFYRGTNNAIFRVNTVYEQENVLIRSYTNSGNTTALGAELNTNLVLGSRTKFFLGGSLYNYRVDADIFGYQEDNSSTNWSLKGNLNLTITDALKFTVDFNMKSATVTAQGRNELFYMANTALNLTPEKLNGWEFSLKVLDFLSSNNTGLNTRANDMDGIQIFYQEVEYLRQGLIAELAISYAFNSHGKGSKKAESTFGKEQF